MHAPSTLLAALFATGALAAGPADELGRRVSGELRAHDLRLSALHTELALLPPAPEDQSSARIGWDNTFTAGPRTADTARSIVLDLGASESFDSVVLIPVNVAYGARPGPGYGFPVRFRVESADEPSFAAAVTLSDHTGADFQNPGNLPLHIATPAARGRYLRITATRLFSRGNDAVFALGEVMIFRGKLNIAAGAQPIASGDGYANPPAWQSSNLNDGQSVLGPPLRVASTPGNGYHAQIAEREDVQKWVELDLGIELPLDEIRIFAARPTDFPVRPGFGFPLRFRVEASATPDFARPIPLVEYRDTDCVNPGDNPLLIPVRGVTARYVRMTATRLWARSNDFVFALSEMQIFSKGENVAPTARPAALDDLVQGRWSLAFIHDGFTSQGELLDWPTWLRDLSRRREVVQEIARLEAAREPLVTAALWSVGKWTLATLGAVAAFIAWWIVRQRRARHRELAHLRQRIAGDLHDEIGSNLGTIALLARLAGDHSVNGVSTDLAEIQRIARETTDSMRDIVWLIHPGPRDAKGLLLRMREVAAQQLPDVECRFEAEGVSGPFSLEFERQVFLLFKEALNNIRKHSRARHIAIRVTQNARDFVLTIADDGAGFDPESPASGHGLVSMKHRAGLLHGTLTLQSRPTQGTHLELRARLS